MSNFRQVWIVGGVIFGLGIFLLDPLNYDQRNWLAIIFIGIVMGLLAGLCLAFFAHFLFRTNKLSWLHHVLAGLLLTTTGLFLGASLFFVVDRIPHGQWVQVGPPPPEKPIKFLERSKYAYFGGTTFIESENGNVFSYECSTGNPCKWNAVSPAINIYSMQSMPEGNFNFCPPERKMSYIPPIILFKKVIDSSQVDICESDYQVQINSIILNDGTVWIWEKYLSARTLMFILPVWLILGLIAVSASYVVLLIRKDKIGLQNDGAL